MASRDPAGRASIVIARVATMPTRGSNSSSDSFLETSSGRASPDQALAPEEKGIGGSRATAWSSNRSEAAGPGCAPPGIAPTRASSPGGTRWRRRTGHGSSSRNTSWCR